MENLTSCDFLKFPHGMTLYSILDSNNLYAFYRTLADSFKFGHSYWNCINVRCNSCIFYKESKCMCNFYFTPEKWIDWFSEDVGYISANYEVNEILIKQLIEDKMKKE